MKRIMWKIVFFLGGAVSLLYAVSAYSETLTLGYSKKNQAAVAPNTLARLECSFNALGHKVIFTEEPTARIVKLLEHGRLDGDVARVPFFIDQLKAQGKDYFVTVAEPVGYVNVWVYGHPHLKFSRLEDLKNYRMVSVLGIAYFDKFAERAGSTLIQARDFQQAMKMVKTGRGDYTLGTDEGRAIIQSNDWGASFKRYPDTPVDQLPIYTMLHKKHAALVGQLSEVLRRSKEEGGCP